MEFSEIPTNKLLEIGLPAARQLYLTEADADDCAVQFVCKALGHGSLGHIAPGSVSLLHVAARNLVLDFLRSKRRRTLTEANCPVEQLATEKNDPEAILLQNECWRHLGVT